MRLIPLSLDLHLAGWVQLSIGTFNLSPHIFGQVPGNLATIGFPAGSRPEELQVESGSEPAEYDFSVSFE